MRRPGASRGTAAPRRRRGDRAAGVDNLVLVHLPPKPDPADLAEARNIFPAVVLGEDGAVHAF